MNSNSRCTSQAPEGEEQGNDHDAKIITHPEDTHVSPRSSRSRTLRSPRRTESRQLQWSNHRDAEAQAGPSEKPIRLREAVRGSLSSRTRSPAKRWWARARGKGRKKIGWMESFRAIVLASCEYFLCHTWSVESGALYLATIVKFFKSHVMFNKSSWQYTMSSTMKCVGRQTRWLPKVYDFLLARCERLPSAQIRPGWRTGFYSWWRVSQCGSPL